MLYENKWFKGVCAHKRGWQSSWAQHLAHISNFSNTHVYIWIQRFLISNQLLLISSITSNLLQPTGMGRRGGQSGVETLNLKSEDIGFQLFHLLPWFWATYLISLPFNLAIDKMRVMIFSHKHIGEGSRDPPHIKVKMFWKSQILHKF
jgi:hypothetical protein